MATVIDSLVMLLGIDDRKYQEGQKRFEDSQNRMRSGVKKTSDDMGDRAKKLTESFGKLRNEIVGMLTAFTAGVGLKDFIAQTVETDAQVGRLAKNLDMSTEELSAWQGVLRRSGGTAQDASNDLQTLVGAFQQIQLTGNSPLIPYLNLLKISLSDLRNPSESLLKIADAFHRMDPAQAAAIGKGMGLSPAMISLLERGRSAVQQMLAEQQKIGEVSKADAASAQALQNTFSSLSQAATSVGRAIRTFMAPALNAVTNALVFLAEWAQENRPIVIGLFAGVSAAAVAMTIPLIAAGAALLGITGAALAAAAPFIALGLEFGVLAELLPALVRWFANLVHTNAQLNAAWRELKAAGIALGSALGDAFAPLMPAFHGIANAVRAVGDAIVNAFGGASRAVAAGFINFLVGQFHVVTDIIRAITALIHGDLGGALAAAKDYLKDEVGSFTGRERASIAPPAATATRPLAATQPGAASRATAMIKSFEGFISGAKWDRNAFRAGYGSDTVTDPVTGRVTRVTSGTQVTRAQADADLLRRVTTEFMPKVARSVGAAWNGLSDATKAALTSIAYNYGSLPANVLRAARTGDAAAISAAIRDRAGDNAGINAQRRYAEAAAIGGGVVPIHAGATQVLPVGAAQVATANQNTRVDIREINVNVPNGDPHRIAAELGPAIRKRTFVTQANSGLG